MDIAYPEACRLRTGIPSALRSSRPFFLTRGELFGWLLSLSSPPASTALREGRPGGLLEGSCGRRERRSTANRLSGMCDPLLLPFQNTEMFLICFPMAAKSTVRPRGRKGAAELAFCYARNVQGLRDPEEKGCLTPVELG